MSFGFYMPTEILSGTDTVTKNAAKFAMGKQCLIVCGRNSAKACGALDDVTRVLNGHGIGWTVFNKIMENPLVSVCCEGGKLALEIGADFIVAIGGGSPLDAAKAIAAYAANPDVEGNDIYTAKLAPSLPIIAIPTTAGTGSCITPVSVITNTEKHWKMSICSTGGVTYVANIIYSWFL